MVIQQHSSVCVLVIDDCPDVADSFRFLLRNYGYTVFTAYSVPTALEMTRVCRPHLILLDYGMTFQDTELVAKLRQLNPSIYMPIIAITGWTTLECRRQAEQMGMNAYIVKPCEPKVLLETIEGLVEKSVIQSAAL